MRLTSRLAAFFVASTLVSACHDGASAFDPLGSGLEVPVALETSTSMASGSVSRLEITGSASGAVATWDVTSGPCLLATASALKSGDVVEVRIHRSGDPLALCVNEPVSYHFVARVTLTPGRYEVRVVDDMLGQSLRPVGRRSVVVAASIL